QINGKIFLQANKTSHKVSISYDSTHPFYPQSREAPMTRVGKIAHLPHDIREQLNRRLMDGETGRDLVAWLNSLPETQRVTLALFDGRPVSEQNLSEWKQGGY